jgi:dipeptidyl aminopeptidase/acylaminoacyl peptidase
VGGDEKHRIPLWSSRWRWLLAGLMVVVAFALGVLLRKAEPDNQVTAPSDSVAALVEAKLADQPHEAALAALSADRSESSTETELAMLDVTVDGSGLERVIDTGSNEVVAALVLARELVTAGDDGVLQVWNRSDGHLLGETGTQTPLVALAETESSSRFLAAVDRRGAIDLVDVTDPERPRAIPLGVGLSRGERPLAIAFSDESNEIVAVGSGGEVLRVDVMTGEAASRSSLRGFRGDPPWERGADGPALTTAKFVPELYEDEEGLLVAMADGGVADLDLAKGQGKTVIRPGVVPGRVLSLDRVSYGEPQIAVGATGGLVLQGEESYEDMPQAYRGPAVPAVEIGEEEELIQGGKEGLTFGQYSTRLPSGPSVRRFDVGFHGIAVIHPGGKVSVLGPPGVGISMAETDSTAVATVDPAGRILVAEGYDANHVEKIEAVRIRPRDPTLDYEEDEVVQTYRPDRDWWPEAEDTEALYLNDVAADEEYVFAAGQDPEGNAAVLVWDAESGEPLHHLTLGTGGLSTELPSIVTKLVVLPEKHLLAAYSAAQEMVAIWSTETWELEESVPVGAIGDVSVSPDEATIITVGIGPDADDYVEASDPTELTFIDVDEGGVEDEVEAKGVSNVAFSPDGSTLAIADQNGLLRLRSADAREPRGPLVKIGNGSEALAWRPDGKLLAVALSRGGVVLVDPESGEVSEPLPYESESLIPRLIWNSEGTLLVALNAVEDEDGEGYDPDPASIWTLGAADLERRMCELAACPSPVDGFEEGGLGDASRLASVDYVFREDGYLLGANLEGEQARIGYVDDEYLDPPTAYDWSEQGLAWVSAGQVNVLLSGERRPRSWLCACSGVAWDGDEVVSFEGGGRRLVRIDPERERPRMTPTRGVPPHVPSLLGLVGDVPVVSAYESEPDRSTPSALFALEPDGSARKLTGDANGILYSRSPSSSPDSLAFLASVSAGVCYSTTNVGVLAADPGGEIDLSFPPSPFGDEPVSIRSLQVAPDGTVSAAIGPIGCDEEGYPEDGLPLAERYLLEGGQWQPTGEEGYDVQAAAGTPVIQEADSLVEPGPIYLETDEGREAIAPRAAGLVGRP